MDLSTLSPEELEELKTALAEPPEDPIQILAKALELVFSKIEAMEEKVDGIDHWIQDQLIGGIRELSEANVAAETEKARTEKIGGLKSKYGDLFSPHSAYIKDMEGDEDAVYPALADHLDQLSKGEGYTDEMGESEVQRIAKAIGERVAALTGKPAVVKAEGAEPIAAVPEGEKKEEPPKEEEKKEEDPMEHVKKNIGKLKERSGQAA